MKTLELSQMEKVLGQWSWEECARGATAGGLLSLSSGLLAFGPAAIVGGMLVGCVVGGVND